jgi:hypothetical protein
MAVWPFQGMERYFKESMDTHAIRPWESAVAKKRKKIMTHEEIIRNQRRRNRKVLRSQNSSFEEKN